jgi:hypothetical protein
MISDKNAVVAVFDSHERAEDAIRELEKNGLDMKKLSIIGKDYHSEEHVVGYYNTEEVERAKNLLDQSEAISAMAHGEQLTTVGA